MTHRLFVLHGTGAAEAGAPWRAAATADLPIDAPDLPGHGSTAPPVGGNYCDVAWSGFYVARQIAAGAQGSESGLGVVVGVGSSGWTAQLLAMAGRADALVLVDALGDPWLEPAERATRRRDRFRSIAADAAAVAAHEPPGLDPRLAYGIDPHGSRELALEAAAGTSVPTLICATGPVDDEIINTFADAEVATIASTQASVVVPSIAGWLGRRRTGALPAQRW